MKAKPKRLTTTQLTLRALRTLTRTVALATRPPSLVAPSRSGPARFIQCWTQQRGAFGVLHALDEDGQVWQLHQTFDTATKVVTEQYWTPLGMERRKTS